MSYTHHNLKVTHPTNPFFLDFSEEAPDPTIKIFHTLCDQIHRDRCSTHTLCAVPVSTLPSLLSK